MLHTLTFNHLSTSNRSMLNAKGELILEPNQYLSEWTMNDDEFSYFQLVLGKILDHFSLLTYGDDAFSVNSSLRELLITKGHYDIIACKIDRQNVLTKRFKRIGWDYIQP